MIAQTDNGYRTLSKQATIRRVATRLFFEGRPITTRGRWFNRVVFSHFALEKRLPLLRAVEKPIFVVGAGRSGTTLLATLFSIHPDVGCLFEPKAMWHAIYPHEDVIGHYATGQADFLLSAEQVTPAVQENAHKLFGAYLFATRSQRVVDKNPELVFRFPFVRAIFPDARFIFLIRDGYSTISSIANWSEREGERHQNEAHDWWGVDQRKWRFIQKQLLPQELDLWQHRESISQFTKHLDMAVVEWIVTMREGLRQAAAHSDVTYLMRYESLLADPETALTEMLTFCDLSINSTMLTYANQRIVPATQYKQPNIHPLLANAFRETMDRLGYGIN